MIRLAQIGFLALTALFLALTVYYYPIPSICLATLTVIAASMTLGSDLSTGAGCLGVVVLIFGGLYGLAYLLFCIGERCA